MKVGLTLMPAEEMSNFGRALAWIKERDHQVEFVKDFPIVYTFQPGPMPNDLLVAFLFRRKIAASEVPYAYLVLSYGNEVFQVSLPSPGCKCADCRTSQAPGGRVLGTPSEVLLPWLCHTPTIRVERCDDAGMPNSMDSKGAHIVAKSKPHMGWSPRCPWRPFGCPQPISRDTSKFGEATQFSLVSAKRGNGKGHGFPRTRGRLRATSCAGNCTYGHTPAELPIPTDGPL